MKFHRPGMPPRTRAAFHPLAVVVLVALTICTVIPAVASDHAIDNPIHRFSLQAGLFGLVDGDGGLVFLRDGSGVPLLQAELLPRPDSRRRRDRDLFSTVVTEGEPGGHRGFSSRADDDRDGRIDEDILDGLDNDGDGAVDEDFAAIGDAMVAVHVKDLAGAGRGAHLEYYHWAHSHLNSSVFLNVGGGSAPEGRKSYSIRSAGSDWLETGIWSLRHDISGNRPGNDLAAFVCRVETVKKADADPCAPGSAKWLGAMILTRNSPHRFRPRGDQLELPLGEKAVPLVVCVADTWLQLNRMLGEAHSVFVGMTDPVDNRSTPWIVPPSCSPCRAGTAPDFRLAADFEGNLVLSADISPEQCGLLDPELFRIDGQDLGAPREIRWQPANGKEMTAPWGCLTPQRLKDEDAGDASPSSLLVGLLGHETAGRLTFVFTPMPDFPMASLVAEDDPSRDLTGSYLDGRLMRSEVRIEDPDQDRTPVAAPISLDPEPAAVEETARGYAEDRTRFLDAEGNRLSLSPELLVGWPNPFRDQISIRFKVPQTMEEAFVWSDKSDGTADIELQGDIPWSSGRPGVSVKIYNVNGQELVTLHSATEGAGEYTVHWNGTDAYGRKVASGPYFCKLQMDDWSVTRQFIFLR